MTGIRKFGFHLGLVVGFAAMLLLVALVTIAGLRHLDSIQAHSETIVENHMAKIELATTMYTSARQRIVNMQKMTFMEDPFQRDEHAMFLDKLAAEFAAARIELLKLPLTDTELALLDEQGRLTGKALPVQREITDLLAEDRINEAQAMLLNIAVPAQDGVLDKLKELYDFQQQAARKAVAAGRREFAAARTLMLALSAGALGLGLLIATIVVRGAIRSSADRERHLADIEQFNRTLQAQSAELSEANAQAQQASHAKSAFLANMSHEIRTPLTAIIGFAELLTNRNTSPADRSYASESIVRNGNHLVQIINDILDLSKIEAGKLEIETVPAALMDMLYEVESAATLLASRNGLEFKTEYDFPLPEQIITDPTRLTQILLNLTNNAIKFTAHGSVILRVSVSPDRQQLIFSISDTGIGMTEEQLTRIFEAFAQADLSTTRRYGGTGLGLSICKLLADRLHGTITAESVHGEGSRFELAMKLVTAAGTAELEALPERTNLVDQNRSQLEVSGRVLLAEDTPDNQRLLSLHLTNLGAEVVVADNGERAVELALAQDFDLILMDMQMPVMDGLQATRMLREIGNLTPIVALTANAMKRDVAACLDGGCDAFLAKPIILKEFRHTIATYLNTDTTHNDQAEFAADLAIQPEFRQLVDQFINGLPGQLENIEVAIESSDWEAISRTLHDLKGMGGGFGFPEITASASAAHTALHQRDYAAMRVALDELRGVIDAIVMSPAE